MNNAGVISYCGPPDWVHLEDYKRQCDVNLWGLIDVSLKFMPLVKKEKGRIVNTASIAGRLSFPLVLPYSIAKTGVEVFTDGIRYNISSSLLISLSFSGLTPFVYVNVSYIGKEKVFSSILQSLALCLSFRGLSRSNCELH